VRLILSQPGTISTRAIDPIPFVNVGFEELSEARLRVPDGGPWSFRIDDEPLAQQAGVWIWRPGFFAGEVTAELVGPDGATTAKYLLDVSPDTSKLGRQRFQELLDEVISEDPVLIAGSEPATLLLGAENPLDDPLLALASFSRLRLHAASFIRAVREAGRQPRTAIRTARAAVELHRVRRVDVHSVRALARTAAVALVNDGALVDPGCAADGRVRVDVPVRALDVDCSANRCVVAIIQLVRQRVRSVREWLVAVQSRGDPGETRTSLGARVPHRLAILERIDADLWRVLREDPWRRVARPEITAAGLNALAADPRYARVHQLGWKALRIGIGGATLEERLWMSPTWEIFERWCFVRLARLVRDRFTDFVWTRESRPANAANALAAWVGRKSGAKLTVLLQPRFPSWDQPAPASFRSVSRERYPDVVLAAEWGTTRRFVVLDAKYRRTRDAVLDAMASAHIYRDSLRWHGVRPELSLLIVPAPPGASWLLEDAFQTTERVGAFALAESLPPLLVEAIGPPSRDEPQNGQRE